MIDHLGLHPSVYHLDVVQGTVTARPCYHHQFGSVLDCESTPSVHCIGHHSIRENQKGLADPDPASLVFLEDHHGI